MFDIALYEPEIPPNTGNIIRLCANTGIRLHLIEPLGFKLTDAKLRRAGLDYNEYVTVQHHVNYESFLKAIPGRRLFFLSTHGTRCYTDVDYQAGDVFLFGPETRGLPKALLTPDHTLRIPMLPTSRSLNLSNTAAILVYEGLRQIGFPNLNV